jgi:hypothetical protein
MSRREAFFPIWNRSLEGRYKWREKTLVRRSWLYLRRVKAAANKSARPTSGLFQREGHSHAATYAERGKAALGLAL